MKKVTAVLLATTVAAVPWAHQSELLAQEQATNAAVAEMQLPPRPAIPSPLADQLPTLATQSAWAQDCRYEGEKPDKSRRGVYPVGNGHVFAYMGLGKRANTMQALTGPHYQTNEKLAPKGHFGELTVTLDDADGEVELPLQRVRRVSHANFVVSEDASADGLALRTLTFAEPGGQTITRVIQVTNGGKADRKAVVIRVALEGEVKAAAEGQLLKSYAGGKREAFAVFSLAGGKADAAKGQLIAEVGDVAVGKSIDWVLTMATGEGKAPKEGWKAPEASLDSATTAAKTTVAWWKKKLEGTPDFDTNNRKLNDLILDWKITILTLRCAQAGVVVPMINHRGAFIRENTGALLTFLRYSMWEEAAGILGFFRKALARTGEMREEYPLDLDVASVAGIDVQSIRMPETELPSWFCLQHFWYFRATRDLKLIKEHLPLMEACLKRQKRGRDSLMTFSGHENYLQPTLFQMDWKKLGREPLFFAESPETGRSSYSLGSATLFLIALQGYGEILNTLDRHDNPQKYASGEVDSKDKPGQKYLERSFAFMQDIEKRFWIKKARFPVQENVAEDLKRGDWQGFFAPAVSPVTGAPHPEPFANLSLMPIWTGFTFTTGEKSRHNLRNTIGRLWLKGKGKRVGTTHNIGHFTGEVPGMLLMGLVERDAKSRNDAVAEVMKLAEPAGEWGRFYDPDGRPIATDDPDWPHRLRPSESGINLDAVFFALNGVRHVNVPHFDNDAIKVKLRLPLGAKYLAMQNLKKDGRAFSVWVKDYWRRLNEDELGGQKHLPKESRRDPEKKHRRFNFHMELLSDNPPKGYYQVDASVAGTVFVRYLYKGQTITEDEFWKEDQEMFFPEQNPMTLPEVPPMQKVKEASLLVLSNRSLQDIVPDQDTTFVDTGMPIRMEELASLLVSKDGQPEHASLYLDWGFDASDQRSFKLPGFWENETWKQALDKYRAAGGKVFRPEFIPSYEVETDGTFGSKAAASGCLNLGKAVGPRRVRATISSEARHEGILRLGSGCGYVAKLNGIEVASAKGARLALPDQDSTLILLKPGDNLLEIELAGEGQQTLFVRFSDGRGLPLEKLKFGK